jgi:polyhydroxyalkanoate synthesis regulator phasin
MAGNHIRNTSGLKEYALNKKEGTVKRVDSALQKLIMGQNPINFNTISIEANVSKTYLYTHDEIRKRIEELRLRQTQSFSQKKIKKEMTESSKDNLLLAKNKKITELSEEVKKLKQQLMYLQGKVYDKG